MDETLVFRKTGAGSAQLTSTHGELSTPARRILILLDGRRNLAELADLFGRETVEREVGNLQARGFVRQIDPERPQDSPMTIIAGHDAPVVPAESAARRKAPMVWFSLVAVVAAFCASAYWVGGREPAAALQAATVSAPGSAAEVSGPAATTVAEPVASTAPGASMRTGAADASPLAPTGATASRATSATTPAAPSALLESAARVPIATPPNRRAIEAPVSSPPPARPATESPVRAAALNVSAMSAGAPIPAPDLKSPREVPPARSAGTESQARAEPVSTQVVQGSAPSQQGAGQAAGGGLRENTLALSSAVAPAPVVTTVIAPATADTPADSTPAPITTAAVQPVPAPAAPVELHARKHDAPQYPPRAVRAGVTEGHVEARLWVTAEGTVDKVDILHANPPRVFDDEVRRALSQWTFDPPGRALQKRVDLDFNQ